MIRVIIGLAVILYAIYFVDSSEEKIEEESKKYSKRNKKSK